MTQFRQNDLQRARHWLGRNVTITMPGWALAAAGLAALVLIGVALD